MSEARTLILGAIAGFTILLGLPIARIRRPLPALRQLLSAVAIGILLFLAWDVLTHAWEPIETALTNLHEHHGGMWPVIGYATLFLAGLGIGLISLVSYERFLTEGTPRPLGPGATAVNEARARRFGVAGLSPLRRLSLMIAVGIGLHNFGEGLAIGGSAGRGEISLATMLVVGFALHNATEGFGIVAPLAAENDRPSWGFLLTMGAIGGAPTFFGTLVGRQFTNDAVSVIFLTLAAGSILYVVIQLLGLAQQGDRRRLVAWGVFIGLALGFVTDMVVTGAGV